MLSLTATRNLEILQFDVKTAFLYGELEQEIYLEQSEGFVTPGCEREVCCLKKCIYGLKQASRVWNYTFDEFLRRFGIECSAADPCMYYQHEGDHFTLVCIWANDGLICSSNKTTLDAIYDYLSTQFKMRSAPAETLVGLEYRRHRSKRTFYVSQPTYISKILARFSMTNCRAVAVPADPSAHLVTSQGARLIFGQLASAEEQDAKMDAVPYREAVGSHLYLTLAKKPDIAFAVGQVSQFCE